MTTDVRTVAFVMPSFAGGGAQRVLVNFARQLDRSRFAPFFIVFEEEGPWRSLAGSGIEVICLHRNRLRTALPSLLRELRRTNPEIVVSALAYVNLGLLTLKPLLSSKTQIVLREANTPRRHSSKWVGKLLYWLGYRFLYRWADHVICPANFVRAELVESYGVPPHLVATVPNPVDEVALRTSARDPRRRAGLGLRFVAVGRLTEQKGYDRLLNDFARLPADSHLTIFGDGELRETLIQQASTLGIGCQVTFAGFDPQPTAWIAGADALLLPSRWEGLPNVALEALACGTPVIASPEAGGIGEIAANAAAGAVTLAAPGAAFVEVMAAFAPRETTTLRPSLLPDVYRLPHAAAAFAALLAA